MDELATEHIPYEIEPEHDLSDLSEQEILDIVSTTAADHQVSREAGISRPVEVEPGPIELYCIFEERLEDREEQPGDVRQRVTRLRQQVKAEQARYRELRHGKGRPLFSGGHDSPLDGTSDEEGIAVSAHKLAQRLQEKEAELLAATRAVGEIFEYNEQKPPYF
jgi:hypothetical protein